jgi:hypothetical protein
MSTPAVTTLSERRRRNRDLGAALAADALLRAAMEDAATAARPTQPSPGRAWINGREVGGTEPLYAHLAESYD